MVTSLLALLSITSLRAQTLVDLGDFGGGFSQARGINNLGQVVGDATTAAGDDQAFLYSNGSLTNLGTLGAFTEPDGGQVENNSQAYAINDLGQIVGQSTTTDGNGAAFLYSGGQMTAIVPGGSARGINASGQIVGISSNDTAFLYANQATTNLGTVLGPFSSAFAINASGQITGAATSNHNGYAFLYSNGATTNLGTSSGGLSSVAWALNNSGQVVGWSDGTAFLYSNGQVTSLGTLLTGVPVSDYNVSQAFGINDLGQVVGTSTAISTPDEQVDHAFLYSTATGLQDLDTLYASLLISGTGSTPGFTNFDEASGINDLGQIVGYGDYWTGTRSEVQAFLITPEAVPEPSAWMLGLVALGSALSLRPRACRSA